MCYDADDEQECLCCSIRCWLWAMILPGVVIAGLLITRTILDGDISFTTVSPGIVETLVVMAGIIIILLRSRLIYTIFAFISLISAVFLIANTIGPMIGFFKEQKFEKPAIFLMVAAVCKIVLAIFLTALYFRLGCAGRQQGGFESGSERSSQSGSRRDII